MKEIENKIDEIDALKQKIETYELNPDDYEKEFDEMLDEVHGEFMGYSASYILKQVDPTAYRCGLLDYVDSLDVTPPDEWDTELSDLLQELEELIEDEIEILENELAGLEGDFDALDEIIFYQNQIEYLENIRKEYL